MTSNREKIRALLTPLVLVVLLVTAGAAGAGVNSWSGSGPFATGFGNRVINALAIDPSNPGIIHAGTGSGTVFSYTSPLPPAVNTGAASGVTYDAATLNGTVNANHADTDVTFEYGLDTGYGSSVSAAPPTVTGGSGTPVSAPLTGLTPGVTYHYRVKGVNLQGTSWGDDAYFTTSPGPATTLVVNAPATATGGLAFNVTVTAKDAFNNTATGYTGTVHFSSVDGEAVLPGDSTLTNGTGTFSATLKTEGVQSVIATDTAEGTITGSEDITVSLLTITGNAVTPGGTLACTPASFLYGEGFSCTACPSKGYGLTLLCDNGDDKTALCQVNGNCCTYAPTGVTVSHTVEATYQNRPVIILNGSISETYPGIQAAAAQAYLDGDRIQVQSGTYAEQVTIDHPGVSISLEGGYNADFSVITGTTILNGSVTVAGGTLSVIDIVVR